jgi:long-subunit fatty acid transport protein
MAALLIFWLFNCAVDCRAQFGGLNTEFAGGGARALAMGGAFIALADDATATEFNPAGLWQLRTPEVAAQFIYAYDERDVARPGLSFDLERAIVQEDADHYGIPSFFSFVYPMPEVTIGISEFTNVYFDRNYKDAYRHLLTDEMIPLKISERAENYAFGLTLARGFGHRLTMGATVRYNLFEYQSDNGFPAGREDFRSKSFSANAGMIYRLNPRLRLGAVYKSPQEIEGDYRGLKVDTELPATAGLGVAFLPSDRWVFLADVDHLWWSRFDPNPDDEFEKRNVWRYHLGAEYYAGKVKRIGVFLRAGYMYEDSNAYRYSGGNDLIGRLAAGANPIQHYTLGLGLAGSRCQFDFGMDISDDSSIDFIASTVWYF